MGHSPFFLNYGYHPQAAEPVGRPTAMPKLEKCLEVLAQARTDAQAVLRLEKQQMDHPETILQFQPGDQVWLDAKNLWIKQLLGKLGPKQLGPFKVLQKLEDCDYKLQLPVALKVHPVFHVDRLSPWKGNDVNSILPPPPDPIQVEGEEEYLVSEILDSRIRKYGRGS